LAPAVFNEISYWTDSSSGNASYRTWLVLAVSLLCSRCVHFAKHYTAHLDCTPHWRHTLMSVYSFVARLMSAAGALFPVLSHLPSHACTDSSPWLNCLCG